MTAPRARHGDDGTWWIHGGRFRGVVCALRADHRWTSFAHLSGGRAVVLCLRCGELASAPYVAAEATIPDRPERVEVSRAAVALVAVLEAGASRKWPADEAAVVLRGLEVELLAAGLPAVQTLGRLALGLLVAGAGALSAGDVLQMVARQLELLDDGPAE